MGQEDSISEGILQVVWDRVVSGLLCWLCRILNLAGVNQQLLASAIRKSWNTTQCLRHSYSSHPTKITYTITLCVQKCYRAHSSLHLFPVTRMTAQLLSSIINIYVFGQNTCSKKNLSVNGKRQQGGVLCFFSENCIQKNSTFQGQDILQ